MTDHVSEVIELQVTRFRHRMISAAGIRSHYALSREINSNNAVARLSVPRLSDSDKPSDGYDTRTTGERINALIKTLGHNRYFMAGHDIGSWVAYPYAARYPDELARLVSQGLA